MLKITSLPSNPEAAAIVEKYINDRLIAIMEEVIHDGVDWKVDLREDSMEGDLNKTLDEIIDAEELLTDMNFAEEISLRYLPADYPLEKANREFFGMYRLLKAKKRYVPELPMAYVLYSIIQREISMVDDMNKTREEEDFDDLPDYLQIDEEFTTVEHIPEPGRTLVLDSLKEEAEEEEELTAEELLLQYEDLREYEVICFEDLDFLMLDIMDMDALVHSREAKILGIEERTDVKKVEYEIGSMKVSMDLYNPPWESEEG